MFYEEASMNIPNDPFILLSYVNTLLRDVYSSLEELCLATDMQPDALSEKLRAAGFEYNRELNQFR